MNKKYSLLFFVSALVLIILASGRQCARNGQQENGETENAAERSSLPASLPSREDRLSEVVEAFSKDIELWGEVVDHAGKPMDGAVVALVLRKAYLSPEGGLGERVETFELRTGADGRFRIVDKVGYLVAVDSIEKEGYFLASRQRTDFDFRDGSWSRPTQSMPYRFIMIEKSQDMDLSFYEYKLSPNWNGEPIWLDLQDGTVGEGGDILILARRSQLVDGRYDWALSLEIPGGGIVEAAKSESIMIAPDREVYKPKWEVAHKRDSVGYKGGLSADFFIKTKQQKFARLNLRATPDLIGSNIRSLFLRIFVNDSGGRVLQDDSTNSQY